MKIGNIELGEGPVVVGTVCDPAIKLSTDELLADIIELRADAPGIGGADEIAAATASFKERSGKPLLITVRSADEGGMTILSNAERRAIYSALLPVASAVDVELSSPELLSYLKDECAKLGIPLIVSHHNFKSTPSLDELESILDRAISAGADITKIAVMPDSDQDVSLVLSFAAKHRDKNIVALSMGSTGAVSRIAGPLFGSLLTYAHLGKMTAPGQFHVVDLVDILRRFYPSYDERLNA